MDQGKKRFCKINFIDGTSMKFVFEAVKDTDDPQLGTALQELAQTQNLVFQLDHQLVMVPMNNVRTIELSPAPKNLPQTMIKAQLE